MGLEGCGFGNSDEPINRNLPVGRIECDFAPSATKIDAIIWWGQPGPRNYHRVGSRGDISRCVDNKCSAITRGHGVCPTKPSDIGTVKRRETNSICSVIEKNGARIDCEQATIGETVNA